MFQTGRIANRARGANLQQARMAARQPSYNPFAQQPQQTMSLTGGGASFAQQSPAAAMQSMMGQMQRPQQASLYGIPNEVLGAAVGQMANPFANRMSEIQRQFPQNAAIAQPMSLEQGQSDYAQHQRAMFNPSAQDQQRLQMAAQEQAMQNSMSSGISLGGAGFSGITQSPQGMNAQNNMALLQQARASRPTGFNPFAR